MHPTIILPFLAAITAGALVGIERSYSGRAAGFRTLSLVCLTACLLMVVCQFPGLTQRFGGFDSTRVVQGVMAGVGFIGAGVIVKDGATIKGLTTAASIWLVSALGIAIGMGFYAEAAITLALALGILSVFRKIEDLIPRRLMVHYLVRFRVEHGLTEVRVREFLKSQGFQVSDLTYKVKESGELFEYKMTVYTQARDGLSKLAAALPIGLPALEYELYATRD
ncbi:MgtC/SapB family protein [Paraburkholderia sp. UCT31]|uniref:MgtC/SapB family protein n=1 Tax=Paraburkholderia sp. UCT31 TaxID=2615209 RepID=UPI00165550A3|nr:MgtC/SapB family protein [Paraburkholderia sp. UCT31]MBC8737251.1 MgtC/SapB family protein [Paraburkholderia sp. UCT31]